VALVDLWLVFVGIDLTAWTGDYSAMGTQLDRYVYGQFRPERVWTASMGLLIVALVAAIWPAARAARLRPVDAMRRR
jgi:ABC-type lipoprotein release transport system permease subunit